jgi:hypothetical protein
MAKITFEFVVVGPPFSVNSADKQPRKHRAWKDSVNTAAISQWDSEKRESALPTDQPVEVTLTTFFTAKPIDVDNIVKPILDSLKSEEGTRHFARFAIYTDDVNVWRLVSQRYDLKRETRLESPSALLINALEKHQELGHVTLTWEDSEGY